MLYEIHIANNGKAKADIVYQFRFTTKVRNPKTFLYNTGPITDIGDNNWNRPQFYSVTRSRTAAAGARARTCPARRSTSASRSTPNYAALADQAVHTLGNGRRCSPASGPTRSTSTSAASSTSARCGPSRTAPHPDADCRRERRPGFNVHTIALQVPISDLTRNGNAPTDPSKAERGDRRLGHGEPPEVADVGREAGQVRQPRPVGAGLPARQPAVQRGPRADGREGQVERPAAERRRPFAKYVNKPELAGLLPVLYPGVFPNLAAYTKPRQT